MKKLILSFAFICWIGYLNAQDDMVVQIFVQNKQYEKAKEQVDKWLAQPKLKDKDKATASLWKLLVYSYLYADPALSPKYPDADKEALAAFYTYQSLDPALKQLKEQHFESGLSYIDQGYVTKGNVHWDAKQYDSAFKYFSAAETTRRIIYDNKLAQSNPPVDTTLILFIGVAAQEAKRFDSAAVYFSKLADIKVSGQENESLYKFLVQYHYDKKNDEAFKRYVALAKELYPDDNALWTQYEMSSMTANTSIADLMQKYQAAGESLTEDQMIAYAEAFSTNDSAQLSGLDSVQKVNAKMMAAKVYAKAFTLNNSNGLYAFNAGVIYFSMYNALDDRYMANRGEGAALKAKRVEISKQEMAYADTAAQWLEKAYPVLKAKQDRTRAETSSLNRTVGYLTSIYYWMRDQTKVNNTPKDYDKYDALYKKYDAEQNSYK